MNLYVDTKSAKVVPLVTIRPYVASQAAALRHNPVAAGKRLYQIALSLVLDNGFSLEAREAFPLLNRFDELSVRAWRRDLIVWLFNATPADREHFYTRQFRP